MAKCSLAQKIIRRLEAIKKTPVIPTEVLAVFQENKFPRHELYDLARPLQVEAKRVADAQRRLADLPSLGHSAPEGVLL